MTKSRLRRYGSATLCIVLAILCVGVLDIIREQHVQDRYQLNGEYQHLLGGNVAKSLADKLVFDAKQQQYDFNAGYQPEANTLSMSGGQFTASLPLDASSGIGVTDPKTKITITMKPQFTSLPGKNQAGRVVYPLNDANATMVYSLRGNGLKEDILLPSYQGDKLQFKYSLSLPSGVEASLLENGDIGIYSADPSLFGNVSYGSASDQALLDKARNKADKTNLAFVIPAPTIKEQNGTVKAKAKYLLKGNDLTVSVSNLKPASYPLSIDPSMAVTSASDWGSVHDEMGNIDYSTSGQLSRGSMNSGRLNATWSTRNTIGTARSEHGTAIDHGYMYVAAGRIASGAFISSVEYAPINADGSIGTWQTTTAMPTSIASGSMSAYNGYLYFLGGQSSGVLADVIYAKINPRTGAVGAWSSPGSGATMTTARGYLSTLAVNGYLYAAGGWDAAFNRVNSVEYAKINPDGTLGAWATTSSFSVARFQASLTSFNNYMYIMGGSDGASRSDVQYAAINPDGTLMAWQSTTSMATARNGHAGVACNGYLYVMSGLSAGSFTATTEYAPIKADGSIGRWAYTTNNGNNEWAGGVVYGNNIYMVGGATGGTTRTANVDSNSAAAFTPGDVTTVTAPTGITTARWGAATAVYGSWIYVIGGCNATNCTLGSGILSDTLYAKVNPDGTFGDAGCGSGSWCDDTTNQLPSTGAVTGCVTKGRYGIQAVAYNGWLYVTGGMAPTGVVACTSVAAQNDTLTVRIGTVNDTGGALAGAWSASGANTFTTARAFHGSTIYNGKIYIVGGTDGAAAPAYYNDVQMATIGADNTVGAWSTATTSGAFTTARAYAPVIVAKNRLYIILGYNGGYLNDSQYATISSTGTIGAWSTITQGLGAGLAATYYNGYLYTVGGENANSTFVSGILYKTLIKDDGTFSASQNADIAGGTSVTPTIFNGLVAANGFLLTTGGCTANTNPTACSTFSATVDDAYVYNSGSGSIVSASTDSTHTENAVSDGFSGTKSGRAAGATAVMNGYLYDIAGCNHFNGSNICDNATANVQYTKLNADGTLPADSGCGTSWCNTTSLPAALSYAQSFTANGYIYAGIGCTINASGGCLAVQTTMYYAKPAADGSISSWSTTGASFDLSLTASNGSFAYKVPQVGQGTTTYYAPISANGNVAGPWTATSSVLASNYSSQLIRYGAYLYIIGGGTTAGNTANSGVSTVQFAKINSDGSLGTWKYTSNLPFVNEGAVTAGNGYLYIAGGWNNGTNAGFASTCYNRVVVAPILSDGNLGPWTFSDTTTSSFALKSVFYRGTIYSYDGMCGGATNFDGQVRILKTNTQSRLGGFSMFYDTGADATPLKLRLQGLSAAGGVYNLTATTARSGGTFGQRITQAGSLPGSYYSFMPLNSSGANDTYARYYWLKFTIDDTLESTFPEMTDAGLANGPPSSVNKFNLYYHPGALNRLRGGKTFMNNTQQSLDAAPL